MIGIWYFNAVSEKWALFEEVRQDMCEERLAAIRASGLRYGHYRIARRRPTAKPPRNSY
jgi:hypothetical protein